mmetsp:Transcript_58132/g.127460  ORF Transcript_58132/g.127460 Transcript_58132/m.127460 type:complete len:306 (-) Transcript_58132:54-971(-)
MEEVAPSHQFHDQVELQLRLEPLVELDDALVLEARKNLRLTPEVELRLALALELRELGLVYNLHGQLDAVLHAHTNADLAEVASAQLRAQVPMLLHPSLRDEAASGADPGARWRHRCVHNASAFGSGADGDRDVAHNLTRAAATDVVRPAVCAVGDPEDVCCEGLHLSIRLAEGHAQRDLVTMLHSPGIAFAHAVLIDEATIFAKLLRKVVPTLVTIDPQVMPRGFLVVDRDVALRVATDHHLLLVHPELVADARVGQGDEPCMHSLRGACKLRLRLWDEGLRLRQHGLLLSCRALAEDSRQRRA